MAAPAPKMELEGTKWRVEHQKGKNDLVINVEAPKQSVYLFKCQDTVVQIKGKVSSVCLDACTKTAVVFDTVIAAAEIVNSKRVQIQANGSVPSITVDKSEGVIIYLQTAEARQAEVVTSASTEVNVVVPGKTENDDPKEHAIPQQFISKFEGEKFTTKAVEHVGV
eukprot:TRINITY_DN594_c0_g1_i1.p1 TRINITY_DN594_c0_g1~~TRINITY_DN594_c0_g1_i1.p1  ORF type:complete len:180 (+),score=59.17 TRINITY_DN594_c0_g1_i1:45-542(+)